MESMEAQDSGEQLVIAPINHTSSFEEFYRTEYRPIVEFACALTGDRWVAEDLAQEAFIAAERKWDRIGTYDAPGGWIRRVVANKSVSRLRRIGAESRAFLRIGDRVAFEPPQLSDDSLEVWAAVRRLPRRQAQVLALTFLEDLPLNQIGEILGCSPFTAKTHLQRGKAALAKQLNLEGGQS